MEFKGLLKYKKELTIAQLVIAASIFVIFTLSVFYLPKFIEPHHLPYILIPLIIASTALIIVNKTKGLVVNSFLLGCSLLLYVFLIEYIASIVGMVLSFFHTARLLNAYRGKSPIKSIKRKVGKRLLK